MLSRALFACVTLAAIAGCASPDAAVSAKPTDSVACEREYKTGSNIPVRTCPGQPASSAQHAQTKP